MGFDHRASLIGLVLLCVTGCGDGRSEPPISTDMNISGASSPTGSDGLSALRQVSETAPRIIQEEELLRFIELTQASVSRRLRAASELARYGFTVDSYSELERQVIRVMAVREIARVARIYEPMIEGMRKMVEKGDVDERRRVEAEIEELRERMPRIGPTTKEDRAIDDRNQDLVGPYADKLMRLVRKGNSGYRGPGAGR